MLNHPDTGSLERQGNSGYGLARNVVLVPVEDGSARLLDMDGAFFVLSATAAEMLQDTLACGAEETVIRMAERYGEEPDRVRTDLKMLLGELRQRGLVEHGSRSLLRRRMRRVLARACIAPLLRLMGLMVPVTGIGSAVWIIFARICLALVGWGSTVGAWSSALPRTAGGPPREQQAVICRIDETVRGTAARIPLVACKERALCCWYFLNLHGIPASLIVGIQLYPLSGHCWCQVGDQILTDVPEHTRMFRPVLRYEADRNHARIENHC